MAVRAVLSPRVVQKTGREWGSRHTTVTYDVQGDPRWFIDAIGCRDAEHFGFRVLSDRRMTVPSLRELQGAITAVNSQLAVQGYEPIPVSFYDSPAPFNARQYLSRFARRMALPVAREGNHLLHDLSFHTGAIFIPASVLRTGAAQMAYLSGFADELDAAGERALARELRLKLVELVDVASSVPNLRLIAPANELQALSIMRDTLAIFYFGDPKPGLRLSPYARLEAFLLASAPWALPHLDRYSARYAERNPFEPGQVPEAPDWDELLFQRVVEIRSAVRSVR